MNLYETISQQVKNSGITYTILNLDNSISVDDIIHDVYLKVYNDELDYIHRRINQVLTDIYRKKKIRKMEFLEIKDDILESGEKFDNVYVINDTLHNLGTIDSDIKKYVYDYFIINMTYKEISEKYNVPLNTIKRKIDKGLEIIRNM